MCGEELCADAASRKYKTHTDDRKKEKKVTTEKEKERERGRVITKVDWRTY